MPADRSSTRLADQVFDALKHVHDQASFIKTLLAGTLGWAIPEQSTTVDEIGYEFTPRGEKATRYILRCLEVNLVGPDQPWGIFILEFDRDTAFVADRGMTGALRDVLRELTSKKQVSRSWKHEHLLFICTHNYTQFRFAYFKKALDKSQPRLAAFGWEAGSSAVRTVCDFNLSHLKWPANLTDKESWIREWAAAFDVEKVTKKFYQDYDACFRALRDAVVGLAGEAQKMYTQTLLNRLMFLRFMERKGWLYPPGRTEASRDYLRDLFALGGCDGKSFFASRLHDLFFVGLAREGQQTLPTIGRVPFLNGGLFEQSDLDRQVADLPDAALAPLLGSDGLFYRYNFTVQESTPLNVEVAVDPEMLGKVFEELVTGRHESGSYYTPRNVVSFMCREALKGYLIDATGLDPAKIAAFVDQHETPFGIADARKIAEALDNVRAVDPACGSGAYLLGLLHEMVDLYRLLYSDKLKTDDRELHRIKLDIIEKCLYGVDKDEFATNIAMLRLWLSLTVDSNEPRALPNLDFKIETGDSVTGPDPQQHADIMVAEKALRLAVVKGQYLRSTGEQKQSLRRLIEQEQREIAFILRSLSPGAIDWRVRFCEIFFARRGGFDIVLANPPYIRQELIKDLKPALKKVYGPLFSGTADLYVFFYLRALQLLAPGGMLAFISSNKWFRAGYGKQLRAHIAKTMTVGTILDFHDLPVFASAIAYPMIFVASKRTPPDNHTATLAEPPTLEPPYPNVAEVVETFGHRMPTAALGRDGTWHLAKSDAADRLAKMRAAGPSLGEFVDGRIYRGLLTGLNEAWVDANGKIYIKGDERPRDAVQRGVFVISGEERAALIAEDEHSEEIIKPLAVGRDIKRWCVDDRNEWIIVTKIGTDMSRYPAIMRHLEQFQKPLQRRRDQGNHWWELRACAYYDLFAKPRIAYQEIATYQAFALLDSGRFVNAKVFSIDSADIYLLGVLNSTPAWTFLHEIAAKMVGGAFAMQLPYVSQLTIPDASAADRKAIAALAQKCLDAKGVGCEAWEKEIDERVASLYGLDLKDF